MITTRVVAMNSTSGSRDELLSISLVLVSYQRSFGCEFQSMRRESAKRREVVTR